ncbi:unnamed protein product [Leuciscus chuanchicus]
MFPDSQIAQQYGCARTKTAVILNTLSLNDEQVISDLMCRSPFSIATDGSTDMDDVKLYPLVVRVYDPSVGKIVVVLLKIVECRESTGEGIYNLIDQELNKRKIPWGNCVSFSADNASVMQGLRKGVAAFIKSQNPQIYMVGCACHLMHIAAEKAARSLCIDIEDMLIVIYYYLDKSSKRKALLRDVQMLCDTDVRKILKLSSTRWLALGKCVNRLLQQWEPLTLFFAEEATGKKAAKPLTSSAHPSLKSPAAPKPSTLTPTSGKLAVSKILSSSLLKTKVHQRKSKTEPSSTQLLVWPTLKQQQTGPTLKQQQTGPTLKQQQTTQSPKEFDLNQFVFQQKEMGKKQRDLSKKKTEKEKKIEKTEVTKPQRILELQLQKLLLAFCKPECVVEMMEEVKRGCQPTLYKSSEHQLPDDELSIGQDTQTFIKSQANLPLGAFFRDTGSPACWEMVLQWMKWRRSFGSFSPPP